MVPTKNQRTPRLLALLKVRGAVFLLFLFFSISQGQIIEIHQLNVDQGDACFIRADTFKILIDGANATKGNNIINPYLTALGISKLNFTVASHHHADHIGGLDEVILRFNPDICYDRGDSYSSAQFTEYISAVGPRRRTPAVAETLINISNPHGKIVLSVFAVSGHIRKDGYAGTSDENTQSIALLLEFVSNSQDTFKFFTAGDLYSKQESILVVKNPELENVHLLKISHHGSSSSTPQILLDKLKPLAVFISVGENNSYGHPHTETLSKLQNAQSVRFVYQTTAGSHTSAKSIIAGHITASVYDRFFTIRTSNYPDRIDTFYFSRDRTLNAEDEPFKKPFEKDRGERKVTIKTTRNGSFTTLEISTPGEVMRRVAIFNILGQLVQEMNPNADYTSITIPNTASGVYLISVFTNRNIYNDKFIITK
jgi:beta-lactamase superfamily II metal-dependent hydrolase